MKMKKLTKNYETKATGNHFSLILYSSSPTAERCLTLEGDNVVCVCMCVCFKEGTKELEPAAAGWLLSHPPTRVLGAWDSLMSVAFTASMSPVSCIGRASEPRQPAILERFPFMCPTAYLLWQQYGETSLPLAWGHSGHQSTHCALGVGRIARKGQNEYLLLLKELYLSSITCPQNRGHLCKGFVKPASAPEGPERGMLNF